MRDLTSLPADVAKQPKCKGCRILLEPACYEKTICWCGKYHNAPSVKDPRYCRKCMKESVPEGTPKGQPERIEEVSEILLYYVFRNRFLCRWQSLTGADGGKRQAQTGRRNNGRPNCCVHGVIIKYDLAILECHADFLPELVKINGIWFITHLLVEALQHIGAGGAVSDSQCPFHLLVLGDDAALVQNRPQEILQPFAVSSALQNLNVSDQAEHRSSPIRASPSRCLVQTSVAGGRLSFGHVKDELLPHPSHRKLAHLRSGHRLNVG